MPKPTEEELEVSCSVCQVDYEPDVTIPMILACGHTFCNGCLQQLKAAQNALQCPNCRAESTGNLSKNYKLEEAIGIIKKLKAKPEHPPNSLKCSACPKIEHESEMWLCRNCTRDTYNYDVVTDLKPQSAIEVAHVALCGSCAIRFHVSNTHETVPYFPVASTRQFENNLESIKLVRSEFNEQVNGLAEGYTQFTSTIQTFNKEMDKMTDMMRKSKSSDAQDEFLRTMDEEFKMLSKAVIAVTNSIQEADNAYSDGFLDLVEQNSKDEKEKCLEGVERKKEEKCSECGSVKLRDEMFGCIPCSEHGAQLMEETIDEQLLVTFTVSSLAICWKCVIEKHVGSGKHEIVAIPEIQKKYDNVLRLLHVNKKGASMGHRFTGLLNTFNRYICMIQEYDKNISQMSRISMEMRGREGHQLVVEELEKTIGDAENAVLSLQMRGEIQMTCGDGDTSEA